MRLFAAATILIATVAPAIANDSASDAYARQIAADEPIGWWRFASQQSLSVDALTGDTGRIAGGPESIAGPRPDEFPDFTGENAAVRIPHGANYIAVSDPGAGSRFDFKNGDAITIEAWLQITAAVQGRFPYIIGKGRTHRPGMGVRNQNWALRLANESKGLQLSFFFCDAETTGIKPGQIDEAGHRWTSEAAVPADGAWHHVAVTYTFGEPDSIVGYVDGKPSGGKWDMGGPTTKEPVVDDDEVWIGASMGGGNAFGNGLDEIAVYRRALTAEQIAAHVTIRRSEAKFALGKVHPDRVPDNAVRVELMDGVPVGRTWDFRPREPEFLMETDVFAISELPHKYNAKGLIEDRPIPWLVHLTSRLDLPPGEYEFRLRSLDAARLYVDGEQVADTPFQSLASSAHGQYYDLPELPPGVLSLPAAHHEARTTITFDGSPRVISLYRLIGNKGHGARVGELMLAYRPVSNVDEPSDSETTASDESAGAPWRFVSPTRALHFTDGTWLTLLDEQRDRLRDVNQQARFAASSQQREYWSRRHDYARTEAPTAPQPPEVRDESIVYNDIDRFIAAKLESAGQPPQPLIDDAAFLRRVTLDVIGTIPTPEQFDRYFADPPETRRSQLIDRLLAHPGWADHWVGYWQDVLAENPGLTKPMLNNTGPFRWFIYESFLDNKPFDQFVTELVLMEGSRYGGGPAGFGLASQNDAPLAAKAHILGTAFLAVEMKCARCHDAPYHDVTQQDLFSLAAMLNRKPQPVPETSSIPGTPEELEEMVVKVTLQPGSSVSPQWPFVEFVGTEAGPPPVEPWMLSNPDDPRARLALMLTHPHNRRFAKVVVNRLWQRYLGRGLVNEADDWEEATNSHPELLEWLAAELVTHDYDLKHVAKLMLSSHTYQRDVMPDVTATDDEAALFAGPVRRRMTAEQLADSLYLAGGKRFGSEELTMDGDGRQAESKFIDLGLPRRAWEFTAVSNERDRPSMSLPVAQSIVDLMMAYGWRQQRQEPVTERDEALTALQPMVLAHGVAANRVVDLSDDSELTQLALTEQPLERLVDRLFERVLSRPPNAGEQDLLVEVLSDGYEQRVVAGAEPRPSRIYRSGVTWANHFDPKSDEEKVARGQELLTGDPPTDRLNPDWRQAFEDAVWSLINSPEFVFVP